MGIKYNEFKEIFKEINKGLEEGNMKESDVIETIKNKLETEYPDVCREWGNDDFNINYLFFFESYGWYTLLYIAVENGYKEIVKALLKVEKIDVNAQDRGNDAPLHPAAEQGHADVVALLLDKGADVKAETKGYYSSGYTSLHLAAKQGHADVVELLLDKGADAKAETKGCFSGYTSLHLAAKQGHADVVALLLDKGADAKAETKGYPSGYTSLHLAAEQGHAGVVALLLDKGADVKAETKDYSPGYTSLHLAAKQGHADVVALLLDKGADAKAETKDYFKYTPLDLAKQNGHKKVVQLLEKAMSQGSSQVPPAAPSPFPQGGQNQPHGEGDMGTDDNLKAEQKKLYNDLKAAIEKNGNVNDVLKSKDVGDIVKVLEVVDKKGNILLIDAIEKDIKVAKTIYDCVNQPNSPLGYVHDALENKALSAVLQNNNDIARKIIEFSSAYEKINHFIVNKLKEEFSKAVQEGNFDNANKFYEFGESNKITIFKDALLENSPLHNAIHTVKKGNFTDLTNILKFAKQHNMLPEVFSVNVYLGKNLLEFAKAEGVEVEGIIKDVGIDMDKYKHTYSQANNNGKTTTFLDKLSEHKGKIAVGTVGTLLIIGGAIAAFVLGQPLIGGIAAAVGAIALLTALAMTTEKGREMWDKASERLSNLFVSKQEPQQQI